MRIELVKASEIEPAMWQAFAALRDADCLYDNPFFDPEFAQIAAEARSDVHVIIASEGDTLVAFWPVHCRGGDWARPVGGPFSDWHGPVRAKGCDISPMTLLEGAGLAGFTAFAMPTELSQMAEGTKTRCGANMTDLSAGWDVYRDNQQKLFPKHFKKIRRVSRNLEKDFTEIEYIMDDRCDKAFDWLIARKREQYQRTGRHDVLGPQWASDMLGRLRTHQGARMRGRLSTLRVDGKLAAAEFNLVSDRIVHGWITVYDADFAKYAPGFLLLHEMLRRMPMCGLSLYDSGPGLDHYKKYYTNFQIPMDSGIILPAGVSASPSRILGGSWRAAEARAPARMAHLMGKVRRRSDQILLAETDLAGRAKGYARAILPVHI